MSLGKPVFVLYFGVMILLFEAIIDEPLAIAPAVI